MDLHASLIPTIDINNSPADSGTYDSTSKSRNTLLNSKSNIKDNLGTLMMADQLQRKITGIKK